MRSSVALSNVSIRRLHSWQMCGDSPLLETTWDYYEISHSVCPLISDPCIAEQCNTLWFSLARMHAARAQTKQRCQRWNHMMKCHFSLPPQLQVLKIGDNYMHAQMPETRPFYLLRLHGPGNEAKRNAKCSYKLHPFATLLISIIHKFH